MSRQSSDGRAQPRRALLHQLGHVDPERIVLHLQRLVELEVLSFKVEAESGEGLGVAVEELGRLAAHDAVEGRHALLAIQQQFHDAGRQRAVAAMRRRLRFGGPDEQAANRMAAIERVEQPAHLVAIPDIPSLELGQRHVPAVDVVEDGGDLHTSRVLPVSSSCIIACLRARVLSRRASSAVNSASMSLKDRAIAACSSTPWQKQISTLAMCARVGCVQP